MKLKWDQSGERYYEAGVSNGVISLLDSGSYQTVVPWNGLTGVTEKPSGAESSAFYADDKKYLNLQSFEDFGLTIEAYNYPAELRKCMGRGIIGDGVEVWQQRRYRFGFAYKTKIDSDANTEQNDYKLHLVFDCSLSSSENSYSTINESPEPMSFSWDVTTIPVGFEDFKPSACLVFDSSKLKKAGTLSILRRAEDILFGTAQTTPRFIRPSEIGEIMEYGINVLDSQGNAILDDESEVIQSAVYD